MLDLYCETKQLYFVYGNDISFSCFSVGFCINEERLSVTNLSLEYNLPMFWETTGRRPLGEDNSTGPWQRTGAVGEGGPAYPDDTFRGALQPRWRTESPWLLDHCDGEAGREEQSSPTSDFQ